MQNNKNKITLTHSKLFFYCHDSMLTRNNSKEIMGVWGLVVWRDRILGGEEVILAGDKWTYASAARKQRESRKLGHLLYSTSPVRLNHNTIYWEWSALTWEPTGCFSHSTNNTWAPRYNRYNMDIENQTRRCFKRRYGGIFSNKPIKTRTVNVTTETIDLKH